MMDPVNLIAYCGINCAKCGAFLATQSSNMEELARIAETRQRNYHIPTITAESVKCDGCSAGGRLSGICSVCPIRNCAFTKKITDCGQCDEYTRCDKLARVHYHVPEAKATLAALRS